MGDRLLRYLEKNAEGADLFRAGQEMLEQIGGWNSRRKANENSDTSPPLSTKPIGMNPPPAYKQVKMPDKLSHFMNHRKIFRPQDD